MAAISLDAILTRVLNKTIEMLRKTGKQTFTIEEIQQMQKAAVASLKDSLFK